MDQARTTISKIVRHILHTNKFCHGIVTELSEPVIYNLRGNEESKLLTQDVRLLRFKYNL